MVAPASCFAHVLSLVDRNDFTRAVIAREAEKGMKGFTCREQFVAMLFASAVPTACERFAAASPPLWGN